MTDAKRDDRRLPFEVWYPASPRYAGLDLSGPTQDAFSVLPGGPLLRQSAFRDADPRDGSHPLILFSHTSGGHRRQSSFLCTHLASHGYIVAAADHTGNTAVEAGERARRLAAGESRTSEELDAYIRRIIADRVPDLRELLGAMLAGAAGPMSDRIDEQRVGVIGWSFGGWAALAALEAEDRFRAVLAFAPAGNSRPLPGIIPATLTFAWKREVPALYLVGGQDRFTPLPGTVELFERTPSRKRMFILQGADHLHFGDVIDEEGFCSRDHAHLFTRGLGLAHMDATLKEDREALRFLAHDPIAALQARGVNAVAHSASPS